VDLAALTLFGRARYLVLACLLALKKGEGIHLREIARRASISPTAAQYELRLLVQAGLVEQEIARGRIRYRFNDGHAIARELRSIVGKTNAADSGATIADDSHWKTKRVQQQGDYAAAHLADKSAFLADPNLTASLEADFRIKR
jgi:DNA-binding MarR family transcriptional regulator